MGEIPLFEAPLPLALVIAGLVALAGGAVLTARGRTTGPGLLVLVFSVILAGGSIMGRVPGGMPVRTLWFWIGDRFGHETAMGLEILILTGVVPLVAAALLGGAIGARQAAPRAGQRPGETTTSTAGTPVGGPVTPGLSVTTVDSSLTGPSGPAASVAIAATLGTMGAIGGILWTLAQGVVAMRDFTLAVSPLLPLALMLPGVVLLGAAAYLVRWTRLHLWVTGAALLALTVVATLFPAESSAALGPILGDLSFAVIGAYVPTGILLTLAVVLPGIALGSRMQRRTVSWPRADWAPGDGGQRWPDANERSHDAGPGPGGPTYGQQPGGPAYGPQPGSASPYGPPPTGQWSPPPGGAPGPAGGPTDPFGAPGPQQRP